MYPNTPNTNSWHSDEIWIIRMLTYLMSSPITQAMKDICEEKGIAYESVLETVESALAAAYRKDFGEKNQNVKAVFDPETGGITAFDVKEVVPDEFVAAALKEIEERQKQRELEAKLRLEGKSVPLAVEPSRGGAEGSPSSEAPVLGPDGQPVLEDPKYNPKLHLALTEARAHKPDANIGDTIQISLPVPGAFGRMAAQTAKQVVVQRLREAERDTIYNQWKGHEGELVLGTVHRREGRVVLIDLGQRSTGMLREEDQIPTDRYVPGARYKFILASVGRSMRGPELICSRTHPDLVRKLFAMEVPEVSSEAVVIRAVAREPGARAKVSVTSSQENVDPIGACIGQRGTRVQTVISELGGEKIDIILNDDDPAKFIANAMAPAKVVRVTIDEPTRSAIVHVTPDQFSLAIGRGGQNVRLAARLTGWRINVQEEGSSVADSQQPPHFAEAPRGEQATSVAETEATTEATETTASSMPPVDAAASTIGADAPVSSDDNNELTA